MPEEKQQNPPSNLPVARERPKEQQQNPPSNLPASREKLEFLKREEVKTMGKDIAKLRELDARKEQERISQLKSESQAQNVKQEQTKNVEQLEKVKESLLPPSPKAQTGSEKIFVRMIAIGVILFVLINGTALGYWYLTKDRESEPVITQEDETTLKEPATTQEPQEQEPIVQEPPVPVEEEEPVVPIFEMPVVQTIVLSAEKDLLSLLSEFRLQEHPAGFTEILVQKEDEKALASNEFLQELNITVPAELTSILKDQVTAFLHVSGTKKRFGFIIELKKSENAITILSSWESTLEQDTVDFLNIIGSKGAAYTPLFRSTIYNDTPIRFQTFSVIDFGIVYAFLDNVFIFTTSFEGMKEAIDKLKNESH